MLYLSDNLSCSYHAVALMSAGKSPSEAAKTALMKIIKLYPSFSGAIVAVTMDGTHGKIVWLFCYGSRAFTSKHILHIILPIVNRSR